MNFANFSHGDFLTFGAYLTLFFAATLNLGFPVACILAILFTAAFAVALDLGIWKPMRSKGASRTTTMILSIGVSIAIRNSIIVFYRPDALRFPLPATQGIDLGGIMLTSFQISVILIAFVSMMIVHALISWTNLGKILSILHQRGHLGGPVITKIMD